jgi:hypothetical protein
LRYKANVGRGEDMKEPRRLLEESPSELERLLLNAGIQYRCSTGTRAKTLTALGIAGSAALSAGAMGVASTSLLAKAGWPKLILALSALGAVTAIPIGVYVWHRQSVPSIATNAQAHMLVKMPEISMGPVLAPENYRSAGASESAEFTGLGSEAKTMSAKASKVETKTEAPATALSDELNALDAARTLLAHGDASGALSRLDAYSRTYSKGRLQVEAEVLRIDALKKNGNSDLAKKRAENFLRKHPNSVLASRVRALLDN